jgi:hypothetical protein
VAAGTYTLTARAIDNAGATAASGSITVTVSAAPPPPSALPAPWTAQDVGATGVAGTASAAGGTFTVKGAGADVWGTADAFHYVWQPISGDVDLVARVASIENVQAWVKAGVMIRERLTADAPHAFMLVSAARGIAFQRRTAAAGISTSTAGAFGAAPAWVKLERRANTISAFQSTDGVNWALVGSDTFTMAASAYVGLAVSSHDATRLATVTFDNVRVQPATGTPPPPTANLQEIVLYAADATTVTGPWRLEPDTTAAAGRRAWNPDAGAPKVVTRRGGARGLRRAHVHGGGRAAVSTVDSRQGGARRLGQRFRARAVLGQRRRAARADLSDRNDGVRGLRSRIVQRLRRRRLGMGRQRLGTGRPGNRSSTSRRPARSGSGCRTARTACRSIRSCCRRSAFLNSAPGPAKLDTTILPKN